MYGEGTESCREWVKPREEELYAGDIKLILAELRRRLYQRKRGLRKDEKLDSMLHPLQTHIGYFLNHAQRMRYAEFRKQGLPIGSGMVEGACKHLVNKRMKRSSMEWCHRGATAVLQLRKYLVADQWNQVKQHLRIAV